MNKVEADLEDMRNQYRDLPIKTWLDAIELSEPEDPTLTVNATDIIHKILCNSLALQRDIR
jgi:hypothetical protein